MMSPDEEVTNKLFRIISKYGCHSGLFVLFYRKTSYILNLHQKNPRDLIFTLPVDYDGGWAEDIQKWMRGQPHEKSLHKYEELPIETFLTHEIPEIRNIVREIIRSK